MKEAGKVNGAAIEPIRKAARCSWEQKRMHHLAFVRTGTRPEDLNDPELLSVIKGDLRDLDRIEIVDEARTFVADCLVHYSDQSGASIEVLSVMKIRKRPDQSGGVPLPMGYRFHDRADGTVDVIRDSDDQAIIRGAKDRRAGERALAEHATMR
jgi:hypothetical protein